MENELSSAIMARVITEKLVEVGLIDEDTANIYLCSVDAEIDEHIERMTAIFGHECATSCVETIYRESELERDIKWRSVM